MNFLCWIRSCAAIDSNAKIFLVKQQCKEFLAFTSLEVRFLVDSSSCNNNSLSNAIVIPPLNRSHSNTRHTHTYANNSNDGHQASGRAVCVYNSFPWVAAELRGCVFYLVY